MKKKKNFMDKYLNQYPPNDIDINKKAANNKKINDMPKKPQRYIDLHYLSKREAKIKINNFINYCYFNGIRLICIIHGKGINSAENKAILKEYIKFELIYENKYITKIVEANKKDGGSGASYIYIKNVNKELY